MGVDENTVPRQGEERPEQHRPGRHARHPSGPRSNRVLSWGRDTSKVTIAVGTLAAAVTAIITLALVFIPKYSDQNSAHFNSIRPLKVESVDDFLWQSTTRGQVQAPATVQSGAPCAPSGCTNGVVNRSCTRVNGQPASLKACLYDVSSLADELNKSASTPAGAERNGSVRTEPPLGELVSVDMEIEGLRGKSVILSWSIIPQNKTSHLPRKWQLNYDAYRLAPTTNDDTGSLNMWIPLPSQPGPYFAVLTLAVNGTALTTSESGPFD